VVALTRIPDTDPGPPLTILVSVVRITARGDYKVTGMVRNDGSDVYGGISVIATFFTAPECGERYMQSGDGKGRGEKEEGEGGSVEYGCDPNWHGPVEVYAACQLLAPGATCPFSLEIYPRDYVSYHLHPEGVPVEYRQPASLTVRDLHVIHDGLGYVHILGTATNENAFAVRDAHIAGTLLDAAGHITSVGMALVPGDIAPGASVAFDIRIAHAPYATYRVQAQATRN
jgi:hypothetical protein